MGRPGAGAGARRRPRGEGARHRRARHARRRPSRGRWPPAATTSRVLQRRPVRAPGPRGARRPGRPRRRRLDAALAGQDAVVHLAAKVDVVGPWRGVRADERRRHPARCSPPPAPPASAGSCTCRRRRWRTRATRWSARRRPGRPRRRPRPLRPQQGAGRAGGAGVRRRPRHSAAPRRNARLAASTRTRNSPAGDAQLAGGRRRAPAPGVGARATPQLVGRIVARARAGRLAVVGTGAALIDTTYVDNAVDALVAALDRAPDLHGRVLRRLRRRAAARRRAGGVDLRRRRRAGPPGRRAGAGSPGAAGAVVETSRGGDDPPMTRFLAEQLSTAHWFDQRETRAALGWAPRVGLDEGFRRLRSAGSGQSDMAQHGAARPSRETRDGVELTSLDGPLFDGADGTTKRDLVDYLDAVRHAHAARAGRPGAVGDPGAARPAAVHAEEPAEVRARLDRPDRRCGPRRRTARSPTRCATTAARCCGWPTSAPSSTTRALIRAGSGTHAPGAGPRPAGGRRLRRHVVRAAMLVRRVLDDVGLVGAVKTSGSKGVHVFVPITPDPGRGLRGRDPRAGRPRRGARPGDRDDGVHPRRPRRQGLPRLDPRRSAPRSSRPTARGSGRGCRCRSRWRGTTSPHVTPGRLHGGDGAGAARRTATRGRRRCPAPQELPAELVAHGHTIPVARVAAMHEGKRRKRAQQE